MRLVLVVMLMIIQINSEKNIKMVASVFRHGARESLYPEFLIPNKTEFPGELTNVGMREHFVLGNYMKQKYIDQYKIIDPIYNSSQMYIKSTDVNRTLMSVQCQLQGMFPLNGPLIASSISNDLLKPPIKNIVDPLADQKTALPNRLQVIPVHTVPKNQEYMLRAYDLKVCPINRKYNLQQINTNTYKKVYNDLAFLYDWTETQFNYKFSEEQRKELEYISNPFDNYYVMKYQGKDWYSNNITIIKPMEFNFLWSVLYVLYGTEQQLKMQNSVFFEELVNRLNNTIYNKASERMFLYSAHDTTILAITTALNLTNADCVYANYYQTPDKFNYKYCYPYPDYASNIQFELELLNDQYFVNVIYNGDTVFVCNNQQSVCTFDQFVQQIQKKYYIKDFINVCQDKKKEEEEKYEQNFKDAFIILSVFFAITFIAFIIIFVKYLILKKKQKNLIPYTDVQNNTHNYN